MEDLKFSVITVSYNQGEFIRDNIESILKQNYSNFEHIVIDGGSTDETVSILKEYPHLNWVSESDDGQCDALNKGFAKATGDVVVWLNSDDWLEPEIFPELVEAFKTSRVVLTQAAETDREGNVTEVVKNPPRNWYDILKYWVPYAWMAQVGVFFERSLLEEVRLEEGKYFDDDLYFTMDYDLWMRMAARVDFVKHIEKVCAYFRIYEDNKTGKEGAAAQRECSRVYRRYSNLLVIPERRYSFIISVSDVNSQEFMDTFKSIATQSLRDIEIILVNSSAEQSPKEFLNKTKELDEIVTDYCIRCLDKPEEGLLRAYNRGAEFCRGNYLVFLEAGDEVDPDFCLQVENVFTVDAIGVCLPLKYKEEMAKIFAESGNEHFVLRPGDILQRECFHPKLAIKKTALMDLGGFDENSSFIFSVTHLLFMAIARNWGINTNNQVGLKDCRTYEKESEIFNLFNINIIALIITTYEFHVADSVYEQVKREKGLGVIMPDEIVEDAQRQVLAAFDGWNKLDYVDDMERITEIAQEYPGFVGIQNLLKAKQH